MNDICPTEAQVVAWLRIHQTRELRSYCQWAGLTPFEAVEYAVRFKNLTWRELFEDPACALAQAFDDWRMNE
jgi:hypothetical protein